MSTGDIGSAQIAAGAFGSMALGTMIFLLMQILKAFVPNLSGASAEAMVLIVSLLAVALALVGTDSDWMQADTWLALVIGTLSATVIARGLYSQLFKVSVANVPPPPDAEVSQAAVNAGSPSTITTRPRDARGRFRKTA